MDSITLQCFLSVVQTGSFTKASQIVGRSQAAVSQQIAKLEYQLDKQLFIRSKILTLTNDGQIFLGYAKKIFSLQRELLDRFKEPELIGEVKFGLPEDFAANYLSDVLVSFTSLHPRVMLNIECDLTINLFNKFKQGLYDLVLLKMPRSEDFPNGIEIFTENVVWVSNNKLQQIVDENNIINLVLSPDPCVYRKKAIKSLEKQGIKWRIVFSSSSYSSTIAAVRAGLGITALPKNMVPYDLFKISHNSILPKLKDMHVSLLKNNQENVILNSLERVLSDKLCKF